AGDRKRQTDVAVPVLHERHEHAERQADSRLRLVATGRLGQLQPAHEDVGLGLELVPVDPALKVRAEPPGAGLPRQDVQGVRVRRGDAEFAEVPSQIDPEGPRDGTDRAGQVHETIAYPPLEIDAGGPSAGRVREIVDARFDAGDVDREGRLQATVDDARAAVVDGEVAHTPDERR